MLRPLFLFVATAGAFHRHLLGLNKKNATEETGEASWIPAWRPMPHCVASEIVLAKTVFPKIALETHGTFASPAALPTSEAEGKQEKGTSVMLNWKRIGFVDLAITAVLTWGVIKYWAYIIHKI